MKEYTTTIQKAKTKPRTILNVGSEDLLEITIFKIDHSSDK